MTHGTIALEYGATASGGVQLMFSIEARTRSEPPWFPGSAADEDPERIVRARVDQFSRVHFSLTTATGIVYDRMDFAFTGQAV